MTMYDICTTFPEGHPLRNTLSFCVWHDATGHEYDSVGACAPLTNKTDMCVDVDTMGTTKHIRTWTPSTGEQCTESYTGCDHYREGDLGVKQCTGGKFTYDSVTTGFGNTVSGSPVITKQQIRLSNPIDLTTMIPQPLPASPRHYRCQLKDQINQIIGDTCVSGTGPCPVLDAGEVCMEQSGPEVTLARAGEAPLTMTGCRASRAANDNGYGNDVTVLQCDDGAYVASLLDDHNRLVLSIGDARGIHTSLSTESTGVAKPNRWYKAGDCMPVQYPDKRGQTCAWAIYDGTFQDKKIGSQFSAEWLANAEQFNGERVPTGPFTDYTCPGGYIMQLHGEKALWRCVPADA
jgi:hypothetical protein